MASYNNALNRKGLTSNMNKFITGTIAGVVVGAAVVGGIWFFSGASEETLVTVGDVKITATDYHKLLEQNPSSKDALVRLIDNQVVINQAKAQNIEVTDAEVDEELKSFTKERFNNDPKQLEEALKSYNITQDDLKRDIKITLLARKMAAVGVTISDQEMKDYYEKNKETLGSPEQVKARHILVKDEAKAKEIFEKVKATPADFEKLAKENSEDPSNKDQGGDLGFFGKGAMVPEFEKAAFEAKKGDLVGPVKTDFGYHIILVEDKKAAVIPTFEEVQDKVKKTLTEQKSKPLQDLYKELRAKEKIDIKRAEYKDILNPPATETPAADAPATGTDKPAEGTEQQPAAGTEKK